MGTITARRPNVLRVDLGAIAHNLAEVRRIVGAGVGIVAALKADAYGFGLERVAETVVAGRREHDRGRGHLGRGAAARSRH